MKWGEHLRVLESARSKGKPTPALDEKPEIPEFLEDLWDDYCYLRRMTEARKPISPVSIQAFLDLRGCRDHVYAEDLLDVVVDLDGVWLAAIGEKLKQQQHGNPAASNQRPSRPSRR